MMVDPVALSAARAWLGTPHVPMAAKRQIGWTASALSAVSSRRSRIAPHRRSRRFRGTGSGPGGRPLVTALRTHLTEIPVIEAGPGTVVVLRIGRRREVHCGILEEHGRLIHAMEGIGVVCVPAGQYLKTARFAAAFSSARKESSR